MKRLDGGSHALVRLALTCLIALFVLVIAANAGYAADEKKQSIPTLKVGYIFTNHHTPLIVAASKGEQFKTNGIYLKEIAPRQRYELISQGKKTAVIDLVTSKSGSESITLFAQKHLDLAMASITAVMAGIDQGTPIKVISPLQVEGMALVFPKASPINDWDGLMKRIKSSKGAVKIGYHSPTSAPKIVIERGLQQAGIKVTHDANDSSAEVLLVDLKSTSNLIPALLSKQVDGWVGPSPFPELAVTQGVGKIVVNLRDLPPKGFWNDFPCCVTAAREDVIKEHRDIVQQLVQLIAHACDWSNKNKAEAGELTANWIGIPVEAAKASTLVYVTQFSDKWYRGAGTYMEILNDMGNFKGALKGKTMQEMKPVMIDTSFIEKVKL